MAIKIHHGPPGSFKTSGSLADDLGVAVLSGRPIVTNVRGLTDRDRLIRTYRDAAKKRRLIRFWKPKHPHLAAAAKHDRADECELIHVDCDTQQGRDHMARWWHWASPGAFLQLDEVQRLWPKRIGTREESLLDLPDDAPPLPNGEMRPKRLQDAFDMHRHANWDMVLTTPSIDKIHADIRGASETAFKHFDLSTIGLSGFYRESFHTAETSGKAQGDIMRTQVRRRPNWVFDIYDSTATGDHTDSGAGANLFKSSKIVGLLTVVAIFAFITIRGLSDGAPIVGRDADTAAEQTVATVRPGGPPRAADHSQQVATSNPADPARVPGTGQADAPPARDPLSGWDIQLSGWAFNRPQFHVVRSRAVHTVLAADIEALGYTIHRVGQCIVRLKYEQTERLILGCTPRQDTRPAFVPEVVDAVSSLGG